MEPVVRRVISYLTRADPGDVSSVALVGSSAVGGLRPDSDIDVLMLTRRSLSRSERQDLVAFILQFSGRRASVEPARPVEVTGVVLDDVVPWAYPPVCDVLYGEWLRDEFLSGRVPERHENPDLAVLLTSAREDAFPLRGPHPKDVLPAVPAEDLRRSIHDSLAPLVNDLVGDERNVLLTLARMVVTIETGRILPKDQAAELILPSLREPHRSTLSLAALGYVGAAADEWTDRQAEAHDAAEHLAVRIRSQRR